MGFVITDLRGINARWQRYNTKIVDKIILTTMNFYLKEMANCLTEVPLFSYLRNKKTQTNKCIKFKFKKNKLTKKRK